jgi:uncharacterized protein YjiS (DUF1127 family)
LFDSGSSPAGLRQARQAEPTVRLRQKPKSSIPLSKLNVSLTQPRNQWPLSFHDQVWETAMLLIVYLFETIQKYLRYRSELASIEALDDRMLHDIGLSRSELKAAAWEMATQPTPSQIAWS